MSNAEIIIAMAMDVVALANSFPGQILYIDVQVTLAKTIMNRSKRAPSAKTKNKVARIVRRFSVVQWEKSVWVEDRRIVIIQRIVAHLPK